MVAVFAAAVVTVPLASCAAIQLRAAAHGQAPASRSTAASRGLATAPVPAASLPVTLPSPQSVNFADPTAVSQAAVIIQWTMDTVTDASQYQAELRSGPFLAPGYLAQLKANPPVTAPGYQWNQWAAHRAYTTVSLTGEPDDQPADGATTAYRQWGITVTPHGVRGWTGAPLTATVFVQLSRAGSGRPWLVSAIYVDPS
jgi:hypothetical protein